ncbi:MAG: hypothetical protein OXH68_15335 [Gammaproteobacteria bacterium]|nr:hypothetical protein [Gammaproteobacteria bacterium]
MDTVTVSIPPGSSPINLAEAAQLEEDVIYVLENTGLERVGIVVATDEPDPARTPTHQVLPRGILSLRTIQYSEGRPIWAWLTESNMLGSQLTITPIPEA